MTTTITTTARRIARETNIWHPNTLVRFDADGTVLRAHAADMHYTVRADWMSEIVYTTAGRRGVRPMTQREAQDIIDAHTWAVEHAAEMGLSVADAELMRLLDMAGQDADR